MLAYFILLALVIFVLNFSKNFIVYRPNIKILFLAGVILVIFAAIRSGDVGTDGNNYIGMFNRSRYIQESIFDRITNIEIGYLLIEQLALLISYEYWSLFFVISLISVLLSLFVIYRLSSNISLSVFIYITLGTYLFFFNGARQAIAASVFGLAIYYLLEKHKIKYFVVVLTGILFHKTILFMIPMYFVLKLNFSYRNLFLFSGISFLSFTFISRFLSLLDASAEARYLEYIDRGASGGYLLAIYFISISFLLIYFRTKIVTARMFEYNIYLNMCILYAIIYLVVVTTSSDVNFLRMSLYLSLGHILIWPIVFQCVPIFRLRFVRLCFYIIHLIFYALYINQMSNLNPYLLNNSIF